MILLLIYGTISYRATTELGLLSPKAAATAGWPIGLALTYLTHVF